MKYSPEELRQRSVVRATEWNRTNKDRRREIQLRYRQANPRPAEKDREYYAKNSAKIIATSKRWAANNPEKFKEIKRRTRRKNAAKNAADGRAWRSKNRDRINLSGRNWKRNNPDKVRASFEKWRLSHPHTLSTHRAIRRARVAGAEGPHYSDQNVWDLVISQSGKCANPFCLANLIEFEVDHIHPLSRGGSNRYENIQLLCKTCNRRKRHKTMEEFVAWWIRVAA